jgi:hypothetical protein
VKAVFVYLAGENKMVKQVIYWHKKLYGFVFIFLPCFSFEASAQQLILKNYKIKDGLPSTEVYCAFQDSKGYIWFGSDGGVSKFDGYSFKNYTTEDGLADNVVFEVSEDKRGRIWFRSLSGKLCYMEEDTIRRVDANELIQQHMKSSVMMSFYVDSGDTIWCGLRIGYGFFKIAPPYTSKDLQYIHTLFGPYFVDIENGKFISGITSLGKGQSAPTITFYKKQNFIKQVGIGDLEMTHIYYKRLAKDTLLIADKEKLYVFTDNKVYPIVNKEQLFNAETIGLKDAGDYVWLGILGHGVFRCTKSDELLWKKTEQILDGHSVSYVMVDKEGGTWFTTLEKGVYYSAPTHFTAYQNYNEFFTYQNYGIGKIGDNLFFTSNKINAITIISSEGIKKNLNIDDPYLTRFFERNHVRSTLILTGNVFKKDSSATYLWMDEDPMFKKIVALWVKKDRVLKKITSQHFNLAIHLYANDSIAKIHYLIDRYRISRLTKDSKELEELISLPSRTFSCYLDKKGVLWLGCLNGLWSYEKDKLSYHGNENALLKSPIEDIKEGTDGSCYYATRGNGILVCKDGKYAKITTANGLNSNNCKCLYIDGNNTIWVGSKNGICKVTKGNDGWRAIKLNLTDNEFSYEVFRIEKTKNTLWLSTNKGLLSYELPTSRTESAPDVYLTQFSVGDVLHIKDSMRVFKYNENLIKLSFVGLSFQSLGKLYYAYKLDGLDTAWHTTQSTYLQYPFLPPGEYTFRVKAVSFGGTESKNQASIRFTIHKPFWKTAWFISANLILVIVALYLLFYFRLKQIKRKEEVKTIFNKKLAQLEMKALRSQMNPHFIFNAINSIQNYIVKNDRRTAQDYLAKFARLIRNVLENSKQENISLYAELETLKLYIELEQLRAPGKFTFYLVIQAGLELDSLEVPPLILQPNVENAILHGLMPLMEGQGELTISLEKQQNILTCIIEDNGIGRKKAAELKQKKQLFHNSMGFSVTEDRIKMLNELHKAESSITIEDKINAEGKAKGTRVIIIINVDK